MYLKNRRLSLGFKLPAAIVAACGITLNTGILKGTFDPGKFLYFTMLSNVFCLIVFLLGAARDVRALRGGQGGAPVGMRLKGAAVLCITTTLLVYWLVLAPVHFAMLEQPNPFANLLVHLFTPVLMLLDWALFDRKGQLTARDPFWWALLPLGYYLFTVVASALGARYMEGSHYPYFFIDATLLGWPQTLLNVLLMAAGFIALGFAFYTLDWALARLTARLAARVKSA